MNLTRRKGLTESATDNERNVEVPFLAQIGDTLEVPISDGRNRVTLGTFVFDGKDSVLHDVLTWADPATQKQIAPLR